MGTDFIGSAARFDHAVAASAVRSDGAFDAPNFWADRLQKLSPLEATGTRPFGLEYQRYLYRLKEAAIHRVLRPLRSRLRGAKVLNVGCGWGYFEPVFADYGAVEIAGVDFVEPVIDRLQAQRPQFEYRAADITQPLPDFLQHRTFDVVAAIDVLYHIVDDAAFERAVHHLCTLCRPDGGLLLWTDAPRRHNDAHQQHCRYRAWTAYCDVFERYGVRLRTSTPMYHLFDVYTPWSETMARHPRMAYPLMYAFDRVFAPAGWRASSNHCALAVRDGCAEVQE